jgi:uncharacterized protein (TIGR02284 family)
MENTRGTIQVLNDLILINNDRILSYQRAIGGVASEDANLKVLFANLIGESHQFKMEIATEVAVLGKDIETGTSESGTLHRKWIDVKAAFSGLTKKSILEECEFGEDAILNAYELALNDETLPAYIKEMLTNHLPILQAAHDKVKGLRDQSKYQ